MWSEFRGVTQPEPGQAFGTENCAHGEGSKHNRQREPERTKSGRYSRLDQSLKLVMVKMPSVARNGAIDAGNRQPTIAHCANSY